MTRQVALLLAVELGACQDWCDYAEPMDPVGLPSMYDASSPAPLDSVVWVVHGDTTGTLTVDGEAVSFTVTPLDRGGILVPDQPWAAGQEVVYSNDVGASLDAPVDFFVGDEAAPVVAPEVHATVDVVAPFRTGRSCGNAGYVEVTVAEDPAALGFEVVVDGDRVDELPADVFALDGRLWSRRGIGGARTTGWGAPAYEAGERLTLRIRAVDWHGTPGPWTDDLDVTIPRHGTDSFTMDSP